MPSTELPQGRCPAVDEGGVSDVLSQSEIDALLAGAGDADRFARQQALMPYLHLLPEHLRGRNERLGEE